MSDKAFSRDELSEALRALHSTTAKCQKALTKLSDGTPQHTLVKRRISAFLIAAQLIERELSSHESDL